MPPKKTVTLATRCKKAGQHRVQHTDTKTKKVSFPCRPKPKPLAGPKSSCSQGLKRKLVKVTSKKTGKVTEVWRCAAKPKGPRVAGHPCKTVGTVLRSVMVKGEKKLRCAKVPKGPVTIHTPCKKAGTSRVQVIRKKGAKTTTTFTCRKSATKGDRACSKPGQVRRPVMVGGKKVLRCRAILKRGTSTNTYQPLYKMFETGGAPKTRALKACPANKFRTLVTLTGGKKAYRCRALARGKTLKMFPTRKARRTPLYLNANPTMTDVINASDASLIRVLEAPIPRRRTPKARAAKRRASPKARATKRRASPKARKTPTKRRRTATPSGPRRSSRIASRR